MGKYDRLTAWLREKTDDVVELTFADLEALVGQLPRSATAYRPWWGNNTKHPQASAWLASGWLATPDIAARTVTFARGEPASRPGSGRAMILDGRVALEEVVRRAGWPSLLAAFAQHTVFLHPDTVQQAGADALFPVIRDPARRGEIVDTANGRRVLLDDNSSPTLAFLWAADRTKGPDIQFNHVWRQSNDVRCYTALWNLCCTPAFLAKACDTHPIVTEALRYRAEHLYGYRPEGALAARKPDGYDELVWAAFPAPVANLESILRKRLRSSLLSRPGIAARQIGWRFSSGPDDTLQAPVNAQPVQLTGRAQF